MSPDAVVSICRRIESISFYPICCFTADKVLYPAEGAVKQSALVYDEPFARLLLMTDGLVEDNMFPDVFYHVCHYEQELTCIMGPFSHKAFHKDVQRSFCHIHHIPNFTMAIRKAGQEQVRDAASLFSDLLHMHGVYERNPESFPYGETAESRGVDPAENKAGEPDDRGRNTGRDDDYPSLPRAPYQLEKELLEALKQDERERFWKALQRLSEYQAGPYAGNASKYVEYGAVMLVSSMTRAVIDGGVPSEDAYEVSDRILYELSLAHGPEEYDRISRRSFAQFLTLSHRYHGSQGVSPHIRRCQAYISHHLKQELSPDILAEYLGLNRDYLLHLFTEVTGESLMKYIQKQRIEDAKNRLKYSDKSILEIADIYQFKNQSHFTRVFRQYNGMTPTEYRKQFKPNTL